MLWQWWASGIIELAFLEVMSSNTFIIVVNPAFGITLLHSRWSCSSSVGWKERKVTKKLLLSQTCLPCLTPILFLITVFLCIGFIMLSQTSRLALFFLYMACIRSLFLDFWSRIMHCDILWGFFPLFLPLLLVVFEGVSYALLVSCFSGLDKYSRKSWTSYRASF